MNARAPLPVAASAAGASLLSRKRESVTVCRRKYAQHAWIRGRTRLLARALARARRARSGGVGADAAVGRGAEGTLRASAGIRRVPAGPVRRARRSLHRAVAARRRGRVSTPRRQCGFPRVVLPGASRPRGRSFGPGLLPRSTRRRLSTHAVAQGARQLGGIQRTLPSVESAGGLRAARRAAVRAGEPGEVEQPGLDGAPAVARRAAGRSAVNAPQGLRVHAAPVRTEPAGIFARGRAGVERRRRPRSRPLLACQSHATRRRHGHVRRGVAVARRARR